MEGLRDAFLLDKLGHQVKLSLGSVADAIYSLRIQESVEAIHNG